MPLTLRPAIPAELPTIATLMNRAFRGSGPEASWNTEAPFLTGNRTDAEALAEDLAAKPHAHLLVSGSPIHASVWLEPQSPTLWYLGSLTVSPTLQNSGLGRQLLTAAEDFAATHGALTIRITVINLRETLITWYQRRGYVLTGETHPFPYDNPRFGTPSAPTSTSWSSKNPTLHLREAKVGSGEADLPRHSPHHKLLPDQSP